MKDKKKSKVNLGGRPTKYKEEYDREAYEYCLLGYTDSELAKAFNVNEDTIHEWKKVHESFSESLKNGKERADMQVVKALRKRALGMTLPETKVFCYEGETFTADVDKYYPPDTTAAIFWLKNRQPKYWRDKVETEHSGEVKANWSF